MADRDDYADEFGDGCFTDREDEGGFGYVPLNVKSEEPFATGSVLRDACEGWYSEDTEKAILLEKIRRRSVELDEAIFEFIQVVRKKAVWFSLVFSAVVLMIGIPTITYKLYRLFSPNERPAVPIERPVPQSEIMVASYVVVHPTWSKRRKTVSNNHARKQKTKNFWINAFKDE